MTNINVSIDMIIDSIIDAYEGDDLFTYKDKVTNQLEDAEDAEERDE